MITWLRAGGASVGAQCRRRCDLDVGGRGTGIAPSATTLAQLPGGGLVSTGVDGVVRSSDGGVTWPRYGAAITPAPVGVVHSPTAKATLAWSAACGPQAVVRLDDQ